LVIGAWVLQTLRWKCNFGQMCFEQEYRNGAMMSCAESGITCLASAMEGPRKLLCVASNDCIITIRDAITGLLIRSLDGHTKTPLCMCVVNNTVYSGGTDKSVQAYNLNVSVCYVCCG